MIKKRILQQLVLLILIFVVVLSYNTYVMPFHNALGKSIFKTFMLASLFYLNILFLFPKFYKENVNIKYLIVSFLAIIVFTYVSVKLEFNLFFDHPPKREPPKFGPNPKVMEIIREFCWMSLILLMGTFYNVQMRLQKTLLEKRRLKEEHLQTELKLLKSQINPHFLFNALNNVYSLSYMKSEKAPESILQLSAMLRYVIDDCKEETVTIQDELNYINNYISFQKLKSDGNQNITLHYEDSVLGLKIAPMLFIPFIENSFKYSLIESEKEAYIEINLAYQNEELQFSIINSLPEKKVSSGNLMGIRNVKQRLEILYPHRHTLGISKKEKEYRVNLHIKL